MFELIRDCDSFHHHFTQVCLALQRKTALTAECRQLCAHELEQFLRASSCEQHALALALTAIHATALAGLAARHWLR